MVEEGRASAAWEGYVDWRRRPAVRGRHGGMPAASFVLAAEVLENLAFLANASNLVTYLTGVMGFSPARAATAVTNFMGTSFLLALLGGFLSDAFFTAYYIYLVGAAVEFLGLVVLTVQARTAAMKPSRCSPLRAPCEGLSWQKAALLFGGLYLVALGVGGIKGSLPAHGAEQFDDGTPRGRRARSTFFNYFVFCLSGGALVAVTLVVWVEDNKGWQWGFGISTLAILLSIPVFLAGSASYRNKLPTGSPLTTITKVVLGAICSTRAPHQNPGGAVADIAGGSPGKMVAGTGEQEDGSAKGVIQGRLSAGLRFLNKAAERTPVHPALACSAEEVEEVKIVVKILPIFFSTIMLSCCLAQLSTFSVQQAATMDTRVGGLTVPPASLPVFPVVFIMVLAPLYDHVVVPFSRKVTGNEAGVTHLQRIGAGLVLSVAAMATAALVEGKRKQVATANGMLDAGGPLPITFFWVALQYLFLGSADLFTLAGLLEFFFTEAPPSMRSLATSLSWASLAMGYYLSSILVSLVNGATGRAGHRPWLSGGNLNHYRLDRFYWLMCALSFANLLHYLFWAVRFKYRPPAAAEDCPYGGDGDGDGRSAR